MSKLPISMRLLLSVLALVLVAIMLKLGVWQLDRSQFKATKQTMFNQRISQNIKQLPVDLVSVEDWSYFRVTASGEYLSDAGFFVDNVVNQTVTGVSVVTPLQIQDSENLILVNRGWLPWGVDRTFLPAIQTPTGKVDLTGLLIPATEGHFYLDDPDESSELSNLWLQLDLQRFIRTTENPVQSLILILDQDQPGSYESIWKLQDDNWITRHKAYAFQWFALAIALLLITLIMNIKTRKKGAQND